MGFLSFSRPPKQAKLSPTTERRSSVAAPTAPVGYDWTPSDSTLRRAAATRATVPSFPEKLEPLFPIGSLPPRNTSMPAKHTRSESEQIAMMNRPVGPPRRLNRNSIKRPMSNVLAPSLPPGAAPPSLWNLDDKELEFSPVDLDLHLEPFARGHHRSVSMPLHAQSTPFLGALDQSTTSGNFNDIFSSSAATMSNAPIVPPRSHLRGPAIASKSTSNLSSPTPSRSRTPLATASPNTPPSLASSSGQFVLEVAAPLPQSPERYSPPSTSGVENYDDDHVEVISFTKPPMRKGAKPSMSSLSGDRDPFKIRDGREPRKSSSGVYTPTTFRGAATVVPTQAVPVPASPSPQAGPLTPACPTAIQARPRRQPPNSVRTRTLSGFKRLSMAIGGNNPMPPSPSPARNSHYQISQSIQTPRSPTVFAPQYASYTPRSTPAASHSPSSAHSTSSASPPATPTTPTSSTDHHNASYSAARSVVIIPADHDLMDLRGEPLSSLGLDLDNTKSTPGSVTPQSFTTPTPPRSQVATAPPSTGSSSTGGKRPRRKPVPRLEDDLVERLERLQT